MASTGSWSVVGKAKKPKGSSQPMTKSQKKLQADKMPKVEIIAAAHESSTIYEALIAKEKQKQEKRFVDKIESGKRSPGRGISDGSGRRNANVNKKKKTEPEKKKCSFEEAIKEVTEEELKSVLMQSKGFFPDKSEVWMKDLVSYLNIKLEHVPANEKYLKSEHRGYPLSGVSSSCVKFFTSVIKDCSVPTLEHLLYYCIHTMLDEDQKGVSTFGYKIFLQILAKTKPEVVMSKIEQYKDLLKSTQNRPQQYLVVLWTLGQVGVTDLRRGLRVWLDIMLPCLGMRNMAGYCVEYLETLLSSHSKKLKSANGEIKLREYFHILDLVFGTSLQHDLRRRMLALYPQLKTVAYGDNPKGNLRNFFPSYLVRATSDCHSNLKSEVLSCLLHCLSQDQHSFGLWCQYYTKHLAQSSVLMQYLLKKWDSVNKRLEKKMLQQTIQSFLRTNEEMSQGRRAGDWDSSTAVCEELLKKMTGSTFPWRWLMFFFISTVMGIMVYDVYSSKSFKESRTVGFLETYGILAVLEQGWTRVCLYSSIVYSWLKVNVPHYCSLVYDTLTPVVLQIVNFFRHIEENTRDHRRHIADKVYAVSPDFWDQMSRYASLSLEFILDYLSWMWGYVVVLWKDTYHWVDDRLVKGNITTEYIQETLTWSVSCVQNYTLAAVGWCKQMWY